MEDRGDGLPLQRDGDRQADERDWQGDTACGSRAALTRMRRKAMARPKNRQQPSRRYNTGIPIRS